MKLFLFASVVLVTGLVSVSSCGGNGLCSGECAPLTLDPHDGNVSHVAFVSAARLSGNLGGIAAADALCEKYAKEGEKTKNLGGTWKAILSDSSTNSKDRILLNAGNSIINTGAETVAPQSESLWKGTLSAPIKYDQNGQEITGKFEVWTGTLADGTSVAGPSLVNSCSDWTDGSTIVNGGLTGTAGALDQTWIEADDYIGCAKTDEKARLYCINSL